MELLKVVGGDRVEVELEMYEIGIVLDALANDVARLERVGSEFLADVQRLRSQFRATTKRMDEFDAEAR